jgi:carbon-monoxide dehydrogenase small subunit
MILRFHLNGAPLTLETRPDRRVIDLLREDLGLTGAKEGCGQGECGACAVLLDGVARQACLLLAAQLEGRELRTIEGLAATDQGRRIIDALVEHGAVQCGFCSPGAALTTHAFLEKHGPATRSELREALSGNLCRCGCQQKLLDAAQALTRETSKEPSA